MRLGIFAKTFTGDNPLAVMRAAANAGYSCVQYNMACSGLGSLPEFVSDAAARMVAQGSVETGVAVAAVSATYNMIHPDLAVREKGRRSFTAIAAQARAMGAPVVTLCTGTRDRDDPWRHHPQNASKEAWADLIREFEAIIPVAEETGVLLGIEPELGNVVSDAITARRLFDEMRSDRLRIVLDAANLFELASADEQRRVIEEAVHLLGPHIAMAHAKDRTADGGFCAPGKGVIDFGHYVRALKAAGFEGDVVTHGLAGDEANDVAQFLSPLVLRLRGG
ncbi:sugar phosphate isomerase/epimerase family protein [Aestuariivirga litoralis]|uniref:sugar phosphate isomerase/epimerase family protein n=1 Tax=Aestuariivirga litoralis TaxID=2650924 RepID=UPI0018C6FC3B|nr:sugar phosphate isomerase/epimerase [Aestuariivirga litoralis]MBG1233150.1 sugar phosphate isomerase/epimerase [Aestuariivirga litoralis]